MVQLVLDNILYAAHYVSNRYNGVSYTDEEVDRYEAEQKEADDKPPTESPRKRKCSSDRTFPLHLAAINKHCPNSVVELLAKNNPSALGHLSKIDGSLESTPLHCYLLRTTNLQLDTIKILVALCPESLRLSGTDDPYFPIHAIIDNAEVGSHHEVLQYLISTDPTILQCKDEFEQTPLHLALVCSKSVTVELVQILIDGYQDAAKESDYHGSLPIHHLCKNVVMEKEAKLDITYSDRCIPRIITH